MAPGGLCPVPAHWRASARWQTAPSAHRAVPTLHTHGASCHPGGRRRGRARGARALPGSGKACSCSALASACVAREKSAAVSGDAVSHRTCTHTVSAPARSGVSAVLSQKTSAAVAHAPAGTHGLGPVSPAAHTGLPLTTLWRSCRTLPGLWVPPFLGKEEIGAPVPIPRSQPSLRGRLPPSSIGLPSLEVTKASASPTPTSQYPGPILSPLWEGSLHRGASLS